MQRNVIENLKYMAHLIKLIDWCRETNQFRIFSQVVSRVFMLD